MIGPNDEVHTAVVLTDEGGQLVRLPESFRVPGDRVRIRREGERIVLEPVDSDTLRDWPEGFWESFHRLPEPTFDRPEQLPGSTTYRDQVINDWVEEMNGGTPEPWPGQP